jgi:hypothetical protein
MKKQIANTALGIAIEVLYALAIMAGAFLIGWGLLIIFK